MNFENIKVCILTGGLSSEREVSLSTAKSVEKALTNLNIKYSVLLTENNFVQKLISEKPDIVFIALHGGIGEDGTIQGLLETLNIPYTGSSVCASAICMNKAVAKKLFIYHGIKTPKWQELKSSDEVTLELPFVIKPLTGGSAVATSIVRKKEDIKEAFQKIIDLPQSAFTAWRGNLNNVPLMAEEYIPGREITVGILSDKALPVLEIKSFNKDEFYDYEAKYSKGMSKHCDMKDLPAQLYEKIQDTALKAFEITGCHGFGRVDFRLNGEDFYILEINTIPGLTDTSLLPEAAQLADINFNSLIIRILESASKKIPSA